MLAEKVFRSIRAGRLLSYIDGKLRSTRLRPSLIRFIKEKIEVFVLSLQS